MKIIGRILIGSGLFLFGIIDWWVPTAFIIGGIAAISIANEYKF